MEGDLRVAPGTSLAGGYDLSMPGHHAAATVSVLQAQVQFSATCASGSGGGVFMVPMGDQSYVIPASSTSWYPSDHSNDPATFQGSGAVPDLCNGGLVRLRLGGVFEAGIGSTDTVDRVNVRWHYSTTGQGNWSTIQAVVPGS